MKIFYSKKTQAGQGLLIVEPSRSHSDTPYSIGLLWTSVQPDAENSSWRNSTLTRNRLHDPCGIRTRNPSKRAAIDPGLRPSAHWGWHIKLLHYYTILAIEGFLY